MKKIIPILLLLTVVGCETINIPAYIQDKNPYDRVFYASFEKVRDAVTKTFEGSGWAIAKESEPSLFERERDSETGNKQTLIFTEVRQIPFFFGSCYVRGNVYLQEIADNETGVEIRYLKVTSTMFRNFYGYKNDRAVEHIFSKVEENLGL